MTTTKAAAYRLFASLFCASLGLAVVACGDDSEEKKDSGLGGDSSPSTGDGSVVVADAGGGVSPADAGGPVATGCQGAVYSALSDGCKSCACAAEPTLAPSCGKPCWDFLACSSAAQVGKCAASAAGGMATRPQFEACTLEECGAFLAVPGAQVVSSYRPVIMACFNSTGAGAPLACNGDVDKFRVAIGK